MRLKEQAAACRTAVREQASGAHADLAVLPDLLKAFGNKSALPGEIERLQKAILDLGAVNLAALDEVTSAQERKAYLDAQSAIYRGDGHTRKRDSPDRSGVASSVAADVRYRQ